MGGVSLKVRLNKVAVTGFHVPNFGVPLSTVSLETRETLTNSPLAAWVYVTPVVPAFKTVTTRPLTVAMVGSAIVAVQAPGEFEFGGISVVVPWSNFTVCGNGSETTGKAANAAGA